MQNTTTGFKHILGESRLEALEMAHVLSEPINTHTPQSLSASVRETGSRDW